MGSGQSYEQQRYIYNFQYFASEPEPTAPTNVPNNSQQNSQSARILVDEEFASSDNNLQCSQVLSDPDNTLLLPNFLIFEPAFATHDVPTEKYPFFISVERDKKARNLLFSVTDARNQYYYCVRALDQIETDKNSFMYSIFQQEPELKRQTHLHWNLFFSSIQDCFAEASNNQERIKLQLLPTPTDEFCGSITFQLRFRKTMYNLVVALKKAPTTVMQKKLPKLMFAMHTGLKETKQKLSQVTQQAEEMKNKYETQISALQKQLFEQRQQQVMVAPKTLPSTPSKILKMIKENAPTPLMPSPLAPALEKQTSSASLLLSSKNLDISLDSSMQKVLEMLLSIKQTDCETQDEKSRIDRLIDMILNEVSVSSILSKESDDETKNWLQMELGSNVTNKKLNRFLKAYARTITFANALFNSTSIEPEVDFGFNEITVQMLTTVTSYSFDIFTFTKVSNDKPLSTLALKLFADFGLIKKFSIPIVKLKHFLEKIEAGYKQNPYHNRTHAADVLQTVQVFINAPKIKSLLAPIDILAIFTAAVIHDYAHPGVNNAFEIVTESERAVMYNDQSVLESFHCTSAFKILREEQYNIFYRLTKDEKRRLREDVIQMVLGTDMAQHFNLLNNIRSTLAKPEFTVEKKEDRQLLMKLMIKCADVSNPTKPLEISRQWSECVTTEFFNQGDLEREKGLPISPFMDRQKANKPKSQMGFLDYIAKPLFDVLVQFEPELSFTIQNLSIVRSYWEKIDAANTSS